MQRNILILALCALLAMPFMATGKGKAPKKESWNAHATERKADAIFMEALRQNALDSTDAYFNLLQATNSLMPNDLQIAMALGYFYMVLGQNDSILPYKGYRMMQSHFNAHPDDYYGALFYGSINSRLGNTDEALRVWHTLDSLRPDKSDITLRYAQALMQTEDSTNLRQAIAVLNRIERAEGFDLGLSSHRMRSLLALGDTTGIKAELTHIFTTGGRNATNSIYAGDVFMALGKPDSAITYYDYACLLDSTNGMAYYRRAEFYREMGDSTAFDREVFEAVRQENLDLDVKLEIFTRYIRQLYADSTQQPRISSLFQSLMMQHPHEASVHDLYSSYLGAIENLAGAAEQKEFATDIDPSDAARWRTAISLYAIAGLPDKSTRMADRALHYHPTDPLLLLMAAHSHANDDPDRALTLLDTAATNAADDAELLSDILSSTGDIYYQKGETDSAFIFYDKAVTANPTNYMALNNYAYFLAEHETELDRAESLSSIALRQQPENDTFLDTYAWILFKKKDYEAARLYIDKALDIEGDEPAADVLQHAGDIYFHCRQYDRALEFWRQALKLEPDNELLIKKTTHKTYFPQ